jgi:hypothetical protein
LGSSSWSDWIGMETGMRLDPELNVNSRSTV